MKEKNKNLDQHFTHPIEEVLNNVVGQASPPESLKDEIFNSLDSIQLISDVTDLFTTKFVISNAYMLGESTDLEDD